MHVDGNAMALIASEFTGQDVTHSSCEAAQHLTSVY